jgi:hypothetical protein
MCRPQGTPDTRLDIGTDRGAEHRQEAEMFLATTTIEDFERFERIFSTTGADKRRQHGSKGAQVFRDPNDESRV